MAWYKTGSISAANGAAVVYGAGTAWVDAGVLNAGDIITINGTLYEILSIQSNTQLTLASNYLGATAAGLGYAIMPIGLLPSALAQQVKTTLATANAALAAAVRSDVQNLTAAQQQTARNNIAALGAADVGAGRLVKSVAGGVDVVLTVVEAANQFLEFTGTLTANINVIVPASVRLYYVVNSTSGAFRLTVKTAAGSGESVASGGLAELYCDGTNVRSATTTNPTLTGLSVRGGGLEVVGGQHLCRVDQVSTSAAMSAGAVNRVIGISAPFGANAASTPNSGAKWGIALTGDGNSMAAIGGLKSAGIYAVSEDGSAGYNRAVGLAFHVSAFDAVEAEVFRIRGNGNVLVGTVAENGSDKLQVAGSAYVRDGLSPTYTHVVRGDLSANAWTSLFQGNVMPSGLYLMRAEVHTSGAGGIVYDTTFAGHLYWHAGPTNTAASCEILTHFSGHALNEVVMRFRTRMTPAGSPGLTLFELHTTEMLSGLDGTGTKRIVIKFIRIG